MSRDNTETPIVVRGTELLASDPPRVRLQKLARITLDSMVQFVGLLDAQGTVLEINAVALDAVGIKLAEVEGRPFWTSFWWQVSDEINATLRSSIARAAAGEFVRWDTPIYGRAGGKETIIIDASLAPVVDRDGNVVFICAEGRDITEKKAHEREIAQKNIELQGLLERIRELDEIKTQFFANVSHELRTPLALILGPAQRLIDDDGTLELAQRREAGQVVARNARMLLKHVNDLLDMSKLEAKNQGMVDDLRAAVPERRAPLAAVPATSGKSRVLVVEDNADMNRFVVQCLARYYDVVSAFDGREGLEQALRMQPTLIVSDIMMPNVSGVEMIAEMRKVPELQSTPILLLSAKADEDLMVKLLDDGAQDFIVKPFSEKELVVRVRNLVLAQIAREQVSGLRLAAESANRAKDEFLAMLGHELRNPLSPIQTALQLMKLRGEAGSERERTVIERQVSHLTRLVDDLLDVSRIARGRVELKTENVELAEVVGKAIEMASPLLEYGTHTLKVDVARRGLCVHGDVTRLSQVISNLLTNAAKYTPRAGEISVSAKRVDADIVLSVRDTGIGIAPEVLSHIFELFVQERQALDRSQGGLGIGLAIVRNLIELHGGSVSARSDGLGKGSEFVVRLPAAEQTEGAAACAPAVAPALAAAESPESARRILVVDDNEDGAELLAEALSRKGYETRVAHDAPSALRVATEFWPEIAFLDIGLPIMDGYELATHLRNIPGLANVELIAITGYGQETDRQRSRAAGFKHHLVKPVDMEDIEATLRASTAPV